MTDTVSAADVTTLGDPIYQGEGKWFKFTFEVDDAPFSLVGAAFVFSVKQNLTDVAFVYQAAPGAFDSSLIASGIIRVCITSTATLTMEGTYYGELATTVTALTNIDKKLIKFKVKKAVTP